jgi:hypothetical protein
MMLLVVVAGVFEMTLPLFWIHWDESFPEGILLKVKVSSYE